MQARNIDGFRNIILDRATRDNALLVLNTPIQSKSIFECVWGGASYKIFADGGANRVYDLYDDETRSSKLPDIIHGDLDSIRPEVANWYKSQSVPLSRLVDDYSTDFGKAVGKIVNHFTKSEETLPAVDVVVTGTISGRVDQGIGQLNELLRYQTRHPTLQFWLVSECSISFILQPDTCTSIALGPLGDSGVMFKRNVGILPIYGPATISTRGLEWDVRDWRTEMGGNVSTSNHVLNQSIPIEVETDATILFTVEFSTADFSF